MSKAQKSNTHPSPSETARNAAESSITDPEELEINYKG
jgi:hypothetical protein